MSLIQFNCPKYFRYDLTLDFEDAQCFDSISEPFLEIQYKMLRLFHTFKDCSEIENYRLNSKIGLNSSVLLLYVVMLT